MSCMILCCSTRCVTASPLSKSFAWPVRPSVAPIPTDVIIHWMRVFYRRFFQQQFKRSCLPDGPKVGSVCLSPRGNFRMPSDASADAWLREVEKLSERYC